MMVNTMRTSLSMKTLSIDSGRLVFERLEGNVDNFLRAILVLWGVWGFLSCSKNPTWTVSNSARRLPYPSSKVRVRADPHIPSIAHCPSVGSRVWEWRLYGVWGLGFGTGGFNYGVWGVGPKLNPEASSSAPPGSVAKTRAGSWTPGLEFT